MPRLKTNQGFTLIELIIVIAIIGILATAVLTGTDFLDQRAQAVDVGRYNQARILQQSIEQLYIQDQAPGLTDDSDISGTILTTLKSKGILKSDFSIPASTFYFRSGPTLEVSFVVTSRRYNASTGSSGVCKTTAGQWYMPSCGQLR